MQEDGKISPGNDFFQMADIQFDQGAELLPDGESDSLYEEQVLRRINGILTDHQGFSRRVLKAGAFRAGAVSILGMPALPRSAAFLPTPDALAHYLSAGAGTFAPALENKIDNIVLLPEAVYSEKYLLTHIFAPGLRTLVMYMHPMRLNRGRSVDLPERLGTGRRPGLLEDLIGTLPHDGTGESPVDRARLHKFVLPLSELDSNEIHLMETVRQSYARTFQLNHELI